MMIFVTCLFIKQVSCLLSTCTQIISYLDSTAVLLSTYSQTILHTLFPSASHSYSDCLNYFCICCILYRWKFIWGEDWSW